VGQLRAAHLELLVATTQVTVEMEAAQQTALVATAAQA
jgi:hypothetical protein